MHSWRSYTIRELVGSPISGTRPAGGVSEDTEGVPSLGGENILSNGGVVYDGVKRITRAFFRSMPKGHLLPRDVLINKDGAQTGKVGIYDGRFDEAAVNEHLFILRSSNGVIDQRLLYYYLLSPAAQRDITRRITGSAQPGLNSQFVDACRVSIPTNDIEQQLIAEILTTIDDAIVHTEALIVKTQSIKAGLMNDLFTRGVTPEGKLRPPREEAPELYKQSPLGWVPKEWTSATFEELLARRVILDIQDGNHGELHPKREDFLPEGVPFLMAADLSGGAIDFDHCARITQKQYDGLRIGFATGGDILLSHKGSIGETALVPFDIHHVMLTPQVTYYRVRQGLQLVPDFLLYWMRNSFFQSRMKNLAAQSTRDYVGISAQKKLLGIVLPDPSEQEVICAMAASCQAKLDTEVGSLAKLQEIKRGLMPDLLTGRVRVPLPAEARETASA